MKKLISLLLALVLVMGLMACGNTDSGETTENTTEVPAETTGEVIETTTGAAAVEAHEATNIFTAIWNEVPEASRFFAMGGDMNNMVDNAPGNYSLTDEGVTATLLVPADQIAKLDQASSLMHGMMANHFTGAVFHVANADDVAAFADAMKESIGNAQWICGMPEKMTIAVINGEYVLVAFGLNDNINNLETALTTAYPDAEIKYSEAIEGR